eukprot:m.698221 g.698221  ORF g.698221 m.698221 type:complete len:204 (+) comp22899_c1_seq10:303-914(+)
MDDWLADDETHAVVHGAVSDWHKEQANRDWLRLTAERASAGYQDALGASLDAGREKGAKDGFKRGLQDAFEWGVLHGQIGAALDTTTRGYTGTRVSLSVPSTEMLPLDIVSGNAKHHQLRHLLHRVEDIIGKFRAPVPNEEESATRQQDETQIGSCGRVEGCCRSGGDGAACNVKCAVPEESLSLLTDKFRSVLRMSSARDER